MMAQLNTEPNIARPDELYEMLIESHRDLDEAASRLFNVKLILLLANHIGDQEALTMAIEIAGGRTGAASQ